MIASERDYAPHSQEAFQDVTIQASASPGASALTGMRILVVVTSIAAGGAERVAIDFALDWKAHGAEVVIVTVMDSRTPMPHAAELDSMTLAFRGDETSGIMSRIGENIATVSRLRGMIHRFRPDVIVSHVDRTNVLSLFAAMGTRYPVVIVEHNHFRRHKIGKLWEWLRFAAYPRADRIVTVSRGLIAALPRNLAGRAVAIHNPIRPMAKTEHRAPVVEVAAMGRLVPQKGFDLLIRAFARVVQARPEARLTIWGDGADRKALENMAAELGIADAVRLPGRTTDPSGAFSQAGLFVLPSRYEGFGLVLAEAMSAGLPVVSFDCESGPSEIVRDGVDGLLVPPEDTAALAAAILQVMGNDDIAGRFAAHAPAVDKRFDFAKQAALWRDLLDDYRGC